MKKILYLTLALLILPLSAEGQILKKLKKQVTQKVEGAVTKNVSDKAAEKTEHTLNKMWENKLQNTSFPMGTENVGFFEIPDTYDFDWKYVLDMKTEDGNMDVIYHLKEGAQYLGMEMTLAENMFLVIDQKREMTVMFLSSEETKFITASKLPAEDMSAMKEEENALEEMEIREIDSKKILGYKCQGYQTENEEYIFTLFITEEAGINFNDLFLTDQKNAPKGFKPEWLKNGKGLMMEMQMKDKKDPTKNISMTCIELDKKTHSVNKSDYQNFGR